MVRYLVPEIAGDEPGTLTARGRHFILLEAADRADLLRLALPHMLWEASGTDWALLYGDFMGLVYAFATRSAASTFAGGFSTTSPSMGLVDRSWKEAVRAMTPDDWRPTEYGIMLCRLAEAGSRPSVDPSAIVVFEGADGRAEHCAPPTIGPIAGTIAGGEGAPYVRPAWLGQLTWADGSLAAGISLSLAADAAYYAETVSYTHLTLPTILLV